MITYSVTMLARRVGAIGSPSVVSIPVKLDLEAFNSDDWRVREPEMDRIHAAFLARGFEYFNGGIVVGGA